jgi:hypothetical protein
MTPPGHRRWLRRGTVLTVGGALLAACGAGAQSPTATLTPVGGGSPHGTIGQPVTLYDGIEFTLLAAQCSSVSPPQAGWVWAGFKIAARNPMPVEWAPTITEEFAPLADGRWGGKPVDQHLSVGDPAAAAAWQPLLISNFSRIAPGATETAWMAFEMPRPQSNVVLHYLDTLTGLMAKWDVQCSS